MKIFGIGLCGHQCSTHSQWCAALAATPVLMIEERRTSSQADAVEEYLHQIVMMMETSPVNEDILFKSLQRRPFWADLPKYRRGARESFTL